MKVLLYSDPHLGLRRKANTSLKSSERLRNKLTEAARFVCVDVKEQLGCQAAICAGDLFDRHSNSEEIISEAAEIVANTTLILAGNHDLENREGSVGSLQLLAKLNPEGKFILNGMSGKESSAIELGSTLFVFVPHAANQELFEAALTDAMAGASEEDEKYRVLVTHCNYQLSYEDLPDTSLNLTKEMAERLLQVFHTVFLGHEHMPAEYYDGRIVVLGNLHPTGFSDISDKRVLVYDTETGKYESHLIWLEETGLYHGSLEDYDLVSEYDFIDLEYREGIEKQISKLLSDSACAVRLNRGREDTISQKEFSGNSIPSITEAISKELKEKDKALYDAWEELSHD